MLVIHAFGRPTGVLQLAIARDGSMVGFPHKSRGQNHGAAVEHEIPMRQDVGADQVQAVVIAHVLNRSQEPLNVSGFGFRYRDLLDRFWFQDHIPIEPVGSFVGGPHYVSEALILEVLAVKAAVALLDVTAEVSRPTSLVTVGCVLNDVFTTSAHHRTLRLILDAR